MQETRNKVSTLDWEPTIGMALVAGIPTIDANQTLGS